MQTFLQRLETCRGITTKTQRHQAGPLLGIGEFHSPNPKSEIANRKWDGGWVKKPGFYETSRNFNHLRCKVFCNGLEFFLVIGVWILNFLSLSTLHSALGTSSIRNTQYEAADPELGTLNTEPIQSIHQIRCQRTSQQKRSCPPWHQSRGRPPLTKKRVARAFWNASIIYQKCCGHFLRGISPCQRRAPVPILRGRILVYYSSSMSPPPK